MNHYRTIAIVLLAAILACLSAFAQQPPLPAYTFTQQVPPGTVIGTRTFGPAARFTGFEVALNSKGEIAFTAQFPDATRPGGVRGGLFTTKQIIAQDGDTVDGRFIISIQNDHPGDIQISDFDVVAYTAVYTGSDCPTSCIGVFEGNRFVLTNGSMANVEYVLQLDGGIRATTPIPVRGPAAPGQPANAQKTPSVSKVVKVHSTSSWLLRAAGTIASASGTKEGAEIGKVATAAGSMPPPPVSPPAVVYSAPPATGQVGRLSTPQPSALPATAAANPCPLFSAAATSLWPSGSLPSGPVAYNEFGFLQGNYRSMTTGIWARPVRTAYFRQDCGLAFAALGDSPAHRAIEIASPAGTIMYLKDGVYKANGVPDIAPPEAATIDHSIRVNSRCELVLPVKFAGGNGEGIILGRLINPFLCTASR